MKDSVNISEVNHMIRSSIKGLFSSILVHKIKFVITITTTLLLGVIYYFLAPKTYESEAIIKNMRTNNLVCEQLLSRLDDTSPKILSKILNCDLNTAQNITSIKYAMLNPRLASLYKDSSEYTADFKIIFSVKDTTKADFIGQLLVNYLENIPAIQKNKELFIKKIESENYTYQKYIEQLDTLQEESFEVAQTSKTGGIVINADDPVKRIEKSINLKEKIMKNNEYLDLPESFRLISDNEIFKPTQASLFKVVALAFLVGLLSFLFYLYLNPETPSKKE